MTVTLTYDSVLSRVRLSADALGAADVATVERSTDQIIWSFMRGGAAAVPFQRADIRDAFGRTVSNGWGSTDTGQPWTVVGTASNYAVGAGVGTHSVPSAGTTLISELNVSMSDVELLIDIGNTVTPTGANFEYHARVRHVDDNNFVDVRLFPQTNGTVTIAVRQMVSGSETVSSFPVVSGVTATTVLRARLRASGSYLAAKAWDAGLSEPAAWAVQMATTHTTAGKIQLRTTLPAGVTNTMPVVIKWDNLAAGPRVVELDDYEFVAGKQNFYRVRGIETGAISYVGVGAAIGGDNTSLTPAQPGGLLPGDLKVIFAAIRNSGTGTVNTPTGWTVMRTFGNASLLGRLHQAGDSSPLVTFSGGALGTTTTAQMAAWRRVDLVPVTGIDQLNASAQNIAFPALTVPANNQLVVVGGWKQDDWTSDTTPPLAGMIEIGEAPSTPGDDQGIVWDYVIQTVKANIAAGSFTITGGAAAISRGVVVDWQHAPFLSEQTSSTTPVLDRIWLKSITRPFLNRGVTVVDWSDPERPDRGADFDAVGRTYAIGVTDVGGGKIFNLHIHCPAPDDVQTMDYVVASGDLLFVHLPLGCQVPGGYVRVAGGSERRPRSRATSRVFMLPLRQVDAPGPDVVGAVSTWQTVLNSYASWSALLAANPTWSDLIARLAPPSEVIVS